MRKYFPTISFCFIALVVIFLPFQEVFSNILAYHLSFSESLLFWLTHWYEPVLFIFIPFLLFFRTKKLALQDFVALILIVLGVLSIFFYRSSGLGREIEGFRFTLFGIVFFVFARLCNLSEKQKKQLTYIYLFIVTSIATWGFIEKFLPIKYWSSWRLINPATVFGYGWHYAGSAAQISSVLGGPNQLASYLLPAFFIIIFAVIEKFNKKEADKPYIGIISSVLIAVAIVLTYSRSAILGLLITFTIILFLVVRKKWLKILIVVFTFVVAIVALFLYKQGNELITHGGSQVGHSTALSETMTEIKNRAINHPAKLIFGAGLGTAGPIVLKYGNGIISESWYLQLILELGIVGLSLWLAFISLITVKLFKTENRGLAFGLIAVSITAIFLHTFADNPAMTLTLFLLIGVSLKNEKNSY
jgi:hypothetical protein